MMVDNPRMRSIQIPTINERLKLKTNPVSAKPKKNFNEKIKQGSKVTQKVRESPLEIPLPAQNQSLPKSNPPESPGSSKLTSPSESSKMVPEFISLQIYKDLTSQISEFNNQDSQGDEKYNELTMCIEIGIQDCLISNYGLQDLYLPLGAEFKCLDRCKILISPYWQAAKKLLVLIQGAGEVGPGIWSRSVCVKSSLELGTMVPFVQRAIEENYAVLILNPNSTAKLNETRKEHGSYIWKQFIRNCKADLYIVAHSCGGVSVSALLKEFWSEFRVRVKGIALTDAVFYESEFDSEKIEFLARVAKHWKCSSLKGNEIIYGFYSIPTVSAGHIKHEYSTGYAFPYIFPFFSSLNYANRPPN